MSSISSTVSGSVTGTDEAQIRALLDERSAAFHDRDAERMVAIYAPGVVRFDLAPPLLQTGPEVQDPAPVREWLSGFDGPIGLEQHELAVTVDGDIAFCHDLNRMSAVPKGEPEGFGMWFRVTFCLRRIEGTWLISHEHRSTPFYMDGSFLAATDLLP